jgi:threonine synthase
VRSDVQHPDRLEVAQDPIASASTTATSGDTAAAATAEYSQDKKLRIVRSTSTTGQ